MKLTQVCLKVLRNPTHGRSCEYKDRSRTPPKGWKLAGWEGGLAPAQDRMPLNVDSIIQPAKIAFKEGLTLPSPNCLTFDSLQG